MARQHFLDQLRVLMIVLVVFGHVEMTIGPLGKPDKSGAVPNYVVDDYTAVSEDATDASPLTRWISLARPWCIPLLFWISGASAALQRTKPIKASVTPLFVMTLLGMALNAFIWFLGPADPECSTFTRCEGKGVLFNFSIVAFSGRVFPLVFQMWFTVYLMLYTAWCYPFVKALDEGKLSTMKYKFVVSMIMYFGLGSFTPDGFRTSLILCLYEAIFLCLAMWTLPRKRPESVPLRLVHYALAGVMMLQIASTRFMDSAETLSVGYALYLCVAFKQFYLLGYVMSKSKQKAAEDAAGQDDYPSNKKRKSDPEITPTSEAQCSRQEVIVMRDVECALLSRYWPLCLFALILLSPSTNYLRAGNFTWPYYARAWDRCLYTTFALLVTFIVDRVGRVEHAVEEINGASLKVLSCQPLPKWLGSLGTALYLLHPLCMTLLLQFTNMESVGYTWIACCFVSAVAGKALNLEGLLAGGRKNSK